MGKRVGGEVGGVGGVGPIYVSTYLSAFFFLFCFVSPSSGIVLAFQHLSKLASFYWMDF